MPIEHSDVEERLERIDRMVEEFRAARQRRLVKLGKALWRRTETDQHALAVHAELPPSKVN